jgi:large subunit ribosomal protein L10e
MAKKRKFAAYRRVERPYTRFSKYKKMSYVRARPVNRVVRYNLGALTKSFDYSVDLVSKSALQIRDMALESARLSSNRLLEGTVGKGSYRMMLYPYPHHVLRENPLAAGAGADRMSTGMKKSFGKAIGVAAQVKKGQKIITIQVNKEHLDTARRAAKKASYKLPCSCLINVTKNS